MSVASTLLVLLTMLTVGSPPLGAPEPCPSDRFGDRAECGLITVLENPDRPGGRTISIAFVVLRAAAPTDREPVVLLAGGPGQGGRALVGLARGPFAPVREQRDILLVDQRGTGDSNGLSCAALAGAEPARAFGHIFDPEVFAACRARLEARADLTQYTTDRAADDLDRVRDHLGYSRLILWGGSYGTRLAQNYMRRYPDRVTAAVLDGVVPFDFGAPSSYARSAQASVDRVFNDCRAQPECRGASPDLRARFQTLLGTLRHGPVAARVGWRDDTTTVTFSAGDFAYAVRGLLYGRRGIQRLPAMITRAATSNDLSEFAQAYYDRAVGLQRGIAEGLHFSVFCAEDVPYVKPADAGRLAAGTFFESYLWDEYARICDDWPRGEVAADFRGPLQSAIPTLLVSGRYDPVTTPEAAARVAAGFSRSRHLIVPNESHGAGFGCARQAVLHVLDGGSLADLPVVCASVGPIALE